MSNQIDNGGAAFPRPATDGHNCPYDGMSLRDWLTGMALQRLAGTRTTEEVAQLAIKTADAAIAALKGGNHD